LKKTTHSLTDEDILEIAKKTEMYNNKLITINDKFLIELSKIKT
jgi:hypothetical protein